MGTSGHAGSRRRRSVGRVHESLPARPLLLILGASAKQAASRSGAGDQPLATFLKTRPGERTVAGGRSPDSLQPPDESTSS